MPLLVTGSIGIDTVHTPAAQRERVPGGSCTYFAAAASFQTPVRVVAAVGEDWPDEHRRILESFENIDLAGLDVRAGGRTFAWGGRYFENMNKRETLFTELGVLEDAPPAIPDAYADSRFVFLANHDPSVQLDFLNRVPDRRLAVADTMDLWINVAHEELLRLLKEVDGLVLNDDEATQLTESGNAVTAARKILELGPSFVVVKKGEHGCILAHREGTAVLPAFPAEERLVVDPTGAGDAFAGGMMGYLAARERTDFDAIRNALAWGTVTASFTIESFGLERLASLERRELTARLEDFRRAVHFECEEAVTA